MLSQSVLYQFQDFTDRCATQYNNCKSFCTFVNIQSRFLLRNILQEVMQITMQWH